MGTFIPSIVQAKPTQNQINNEYISRLNTNLTILNNPTVRSISNYSKIQDAKLYCRLLTNLTVEEVYQNIETNTSINNYLGSYY